MEEIIREIEKAEANASLLKADAERKVSEIMSDNDKEIGLMKARYDRKLKDDSESIVASIKNEINGIASETEKNIAENSKTIRDHAVDKIEPCAQFVYDFLMKELD